MYTAKRNWKKVTSGRLFGLYLEVIHYAQALGLMSPTGEVPPLYTRKSVRTFGACFSSRNQNGTCDCAIVLNEILIKYSDDQIRKVIVHEVAHAIHPLEHHSRSWRRDANRLGKRWGYVVEVRNSDGELSAALNTMKEGRRKYRYELYCTRCGATWKYTRMSKAVKFPQKYECTHCKSRLFSRPLA